METSDDTSAKIINLLERRKQRLAGEPDVDPRVELPEFVTPEDINHLSDAQLEGLLALLRSRRMTATLIYRRTEEEKEEMRQSRARDMLDKKCTQVWTELDKVLKNMEKLEMRINEMRALRIQAGMQW